MEYPGGEWNDNMAKHFKDNMAALPLYDLNLLISSWPLNFVCSFWNLNTTKYVQMVTFG